MKYLIFIFALLATTTQPLMAQQNPTLAGDWKGYIEIQGRQLGIGTHFNKNEGEYSGTIDIPLQGVSAAHLDKIQFMEPDSVAWMWNTGPSGIIRFNGVMKTDSTIKGKFTQRGYTFPFQLHKEKTQSKAAKSDHIPYQTKQLIIKRDSIPIGGTLTLPQDAPPQKAVILISGSGAQNRDEETPFGFKPFAQIADYLTRRGIATFRFDDRGIGESGGEAYAGFNELANDVQIIFDSLRARPELAGASIGLLGHSQGGYIADKLAAQNSNIGFIILMSAPSFTGDQIILQQTEAIEKAKGTADSVIQKGMNEQRILFRAIKNDNLDSLRSANIKTLEARLDTLSDAKKKKIGDKHTYATKKVNAEMTLYKSPIFQSMMRYDPLQDLQKLQVPVLALFGEKDLQVLPELNAERLRTALEKSEADFTIKIIDNANHLYQKAKTGLPSEYETLDKPFVDDFLPTLAEWILNLP